MLEQGITVFSEEFDLLPRLSLSKGTQFINRLESQSNFYYNGYVPLKPWSNLSKEDSEKIIAALPPQNYLNSIGIGKLPDEIYHLAGKLNIDANNLKDYVKQNINNPYYKRFEELILNYLEPLYIKRDGLETPIIYCGKKGLPTSTFDYDLNEFPGLHYDSWDKKDWNDRSETRNRICINLGIEERYFLFVNLELKTVTEKLKALEEFDYNSKKGPNTAFLKNHPNYPVIRVRLEPGEYYIAPTEVMIHDATTEDKTYGDVTATFLGYFKTCGFNNP